MPRKLLVGVLPGVGDSHGRGIGAGVDRPRPPCLPDRARSCPHRRALCVRRRQRRRLVVSLLAISALPLACSLTPTSSLILHAGLAASTPSLAVDRPLHQDGSNSSSHSVDPQQGRHSSYRVADRRAAGDPVLCLALAPAPALQRHGGIRSGSSQPPPIMTRQSSPISRDPSSAIAVEGAPRVLRLRSRTALIGERLRFNKKQVLNKAQSDATILDGERATLAESDLVVVNQVLRNGHQPYMPGPLESGPGYPLGAAAFTGLYRFVMAVRCSCPARPP